MRVQEEERKRIARELHDDISQQIASLIIGLDGLAGMLPDRMAPERSRLRDLTSTAKELAESVRELSHQLHSVTLQHLGIARGLEGLCRTFAQQHHVEVDLETEELQDLPDDVSLCLYRVVQEALNNAVKHGNAKQVVVRLKRSKTQLSLEIRDSGNGFNPAAASEGLGLVSMRERLRMVGGTLVLTSSRGKGTVIKAVVISAGGSHPAHSQATPSAG
jgi:signal transduction histidine kinase